MSKFFPEVQLIYSVVFMLHSTVTCSYPAHSVIRRHILFHDSLSQDVEQSSLCYTVGSCLYILYIIVCTCLSPKLPVLPSPLPLPLSNHKSVLYVWESVSKICSFVSYFIFHILIDIIWYLSLFLTLLIMLISGCIHVTEWYYFILFDG